MTGLAHRTARCALWPRSAALAAAAALGCASAPRAVPEPRPEASAAPAAAVPAQPPSPAGRGRSESTDAARGEGVRKAAPPATPRELFERGVALSEADPAGAAALFEAAFRADPSMAVAAYDAGVLFERAGDLARARDAYGRALQAAPDFEPASLNLTRLRLRAGQGEEAEGDLRARVAAHPAKLGFRNQLVEVLVATGRLDAAEQEARRILKTDEHNIPAMVNLATVYHRKGRYELARMVLENARQVAPGEPVVWNRLGFVEMQLGTRAQAMEYFRKAAELGETYPEAQINYGAMLVETEAFPDAVKHLELAVKHAPQSPAARLNLGNAYRGAKEFEKAEREYQRALELDPRLADAWFNMGLLYLDGEKPGLPTAQRLERAIALFDRYASEGGGDPKVPQYRRDASSLLDKERKRLAREERDRLRQEAEAKRREEEEARVRAREEEARRAAALEAAAAAAARPAPAGSTLEPSPSGRGQPGSAEAARGEGAAPPAATSTPPREPSPSGKGQPGSAEAVRGEGAAPPATPPATTPGEGAQR